MQALHPHKLDVIVIGGGIAGSVSAWLAARDGLDVLLLTSGGVAPRLEGLSPRLKDWLQTQGLLEGFTPLVGPLRRTASWSGLSNSSNGEFVVDRTALDAHLQQCAKKIGATIIETKATPLSPGAKLANGSVVAADMTIDARGRRSHAMRRVPRGPSTVSLCAFGSADRDAGVYITALPDGWVWRVHLPDGRMWVQFTSDASHRGPAEARLRRALHEDDPRLEGCLDELFQARESAPILSRIPDTLDCLPVGDALAAMDPLSGHGQFWAVSSSLAVAAIRRTRDARPGPDTDALCRQFLADRAEETYLRNARIGRDFMRLETRYANRTFWARRRDFPDEAPIHEENDDFSIMASIVVRNGLLEPMDILRTPKTPTGIGWLHGIPAADAWIMHRGGASRDEMVRRWGPAAAALPEIFAREAQ